LGLLLQRTASVASAEYASFELNRALDWLQGERAEARRLAAVLVLREMSEHAMPLFWSQFGTFFEVRASSPR
jgi:FKBP12-rapamycin complex-associated protein